MRDFTVFVNAMYRVNFVIIFLPVFCIWCELNLTVACVFAYRGRTQEVE